MKKLILLLLTFILISCQKEKKEELETENEISKVEKISTLLQTDKLQKFEFVLNKDTVFIGKEGTKIIIPKDLFENYTNGKITFELKEFYSKEDMILNGLSTLTDKDELLESSGMFYINFKEEGKQLIIKEGKNYKVEVSNKPLSNSNIYYNDNDSIFKWKLSEDKMFTSIPDIVKNYKFGLKNGDGGYYKDVLNNELTKIKKQDSLELLKLVGNSQKEIFVLGDSLIENNEWDYGITGNKTSSKERNKILKKIKKIYDTNNELYFFTANKLGWINIDKILIYESQKDFKFEIKNNNKLNTYNLSYIYLNNKTYIDQFVIDTNFNSIIKIAGKIKGVIYTINSEEIYFDTFYIDAKSKANFEINLKETTLEKLKQELISQ
ncbi:hypothetical protein FLGE108171_06110 [Flavobacterium gelidilacus]|uniref:hypothetical protein n=1 Tax=Flavobacterium gelidilacus TaxID=206041 RepID=UPI00042663D4|nr:hypothetical protein [Flavobacterium gelidilacus]